jgi:hypothetical protein
VRKARFWYPVCRSVASIGGSGCICAPGLRSVKSIRISVRLGFYIRISVSQTLERTKALSEGKIGGNIYPCAVLAILTTFQKPFIYESCRF